MATTVEIHPEVLKELEYMVALHKKHGAPSPMECVEDLVGFVLMSVADGSRRPGAWERQLLTMMGLVADCAEHGQYRSHYGSPEKE
ncbi:MAG: hypothetical protein B0W54_08120 [Cellvibrio sp. 79]|nr:MAG: hypothetical protein B0W54_08120 [Cellvibrio sp. 79]